MANVSISNENFSDFQDDQFHLNGYEGGVVVNGIEDPWFEHIDYVDIDSFYSMFGPNNEEDTSDLQVRINLLEDQQQSILDWMQNHFPTNTVMPLQPVQIQSTVEIPGNDDLQTQVPERGKDSNEKPNPFSLASLELLKNYGRLSKKSSEENLSTNALNFEACLGNCHRLSMEEILRVAAERYIQYSTRKRDGLSRFIHPYGSALSGLCMEETRDVELVHHLLAAVEEVNNQQFHLASKLISRCMWVASDSGTPVQRLSFYFAKALEERIHRSTGRYTCTDEDRHLKYIKTKSLGTNATSLTCHQLIPFNQVMQFAAVQTIVENVKSAKKIHLIDFNIRSGIQWIVLIQALAEKGDSPIELLKIPFLSLAPFELLRNNPSKHKNTEGDRARDVNCGANVHQKLSAMHIMRLAGERFIQFSSNKFININNLLHPYGSALSYLSTEDNQDVELAQILLAAAEKVSEQQYDRARKFLSQCQLLASKAGNTVQREVFYFAQALGERIDRETGILTPKISAETNELNSICTAPRLHASHVALHQEVPFTQVVHFTGIQAILESVATKPKVHLIDFHIRTGVQWASLIQAAAERKDNPIEHMTITVIESVNKQRVEKTGKSLESFATSLNFPFSFKIVFLPDRNQLTKDHFYIEPDEGVVIHAAFFLRAMICEPNCLETAMRVVKQLQPSLMVVSEVEANLNSPVFVNRFIDSLFYYSALFDCLEDVMKRDDQHRMTIEESYGGGILNIVGSEGKERVIRSVNLDVWRSFLGRFGMEEVKLSDTCLYQANLIIQQFDCRDSCSADMNGGSLAVSWKGTPIYFTSAWKFH